jgi:hypothetical protein
MKKSNVKLTLVGLIVLAGCAAPIDEPERAGFLSDYSKLELVENDHLSYVGDRMGEYDRFIIDPVVVLFQRDPENPTFSDEEIEKLKAYVVRELTERLTRNDGYSVVKEAGPGVARLRIGLTEVEETIGVLNITIYTKITGLGLGGASAEGEMVDSVTGEQIAAMVRWGTGSRVLKAGLTPMGDAKIAIDKWAKNVRKLLDEHHD